MYLSKLALAIASSSLFVGSALATNGDATWFDPGLGACGFTNSDSDFVVALNTANYASGANCGRSIKVNYEGKSVTVEVVDLCPGCGAGSVDLSPVAFEQLAPLAVGRIAVEWDFV